MKRLLVLAPCLLLAGCAAGREEAAPETPRAPVRDDSAHRHGHLVGLDTRELAALLGKPVLEVREGPGTKLQYRGAGCVLDAYLYPPASGTGTARVTYVDARTSEGGETDAAGCEAAIERAR